MALSTHDYLKAALQDLLPPGGITAVASSVVGNICNALAKVLEHAQDAADQLALEVFPHTASECLDEWAALFDHVHPTNATEAEKQGALTGRWRAAAFESSFGIRQALAPILNPTIAFQDDCDDNNVSWRYREMSTNGSIAEDGTDLTLNAPALADCRWELAAQTPEALALELVDREDAWQVQALILAGSTAAADCHCGVMAMENDSAVVFFGLWNVGGTTRLRWAKFEAGVMSGPFDAVAPPAFPFWLQLRRDTSGAMVFKYGASLAALSEMPTPLAAEDAILVPREVGVHAVNDGTGAANLNVDTVQVQFDQDYNNVELIERLQSLGGEAEQIWFAFVHRDPDDDAYTYDLAEAQRQADRLKQGHTLIMLGESDCFRCDDPYSLTDRDILGS